MLFYYIIDLTATVNFHFLSSKRKKLTQNEMDPASSAVSCILIASMTLISMYVVSIPNI